MIRCALNQRLCPPQEINVFLGVVSQRANNKCACPPARTFHFKNCCTDFSNVLLWDSRRL